jgi:stage V sporulation protein D (sporulation-specific penicillin-binding protein)
MYDATGEVVLAVSASSETVSVNPTNIPKEDKEKVARALTDIFDLDYDTVYKRVSRRSSIETIVKQVDKEKTDKLRIWMNENNVTVGINIDEDTKRFYPYGNLASTIIGFTGSDNQGLEGLESYYDDILKGEQGRILRLVDARGKEMGTEGEDYIAAVNGKDLILSIDMTVQSIAERYLAKACIDNETTDGGNVIIMNPKTGDVLAMAEYPNYDLNSPFTINNEELRTNWENLQASERNRLLQQMWRNRAISDAYEPGSTFKILTSAAAIEEGVSTVDGKSYNCTGSTLVGGVRIRCWRHYRPHG